MVPNDKTEASYRGIQNQMVINKKGNKMAIVFNKELVEGFTYIPESQKDEKTPFSVTLQPIDSVRLVTLEDGLLKRSQDNSLSISTGSYNVSLCRNSIVGWENLNGVNGKPIKMEQDLKGYISEFNLSMLPTSLITEIAGIIASTSQDPSTIQIYAEDKSK